MATRRTRGDQLKLSLGVWALLASAASAAPLEIIPFETRAVQLALPLTVAPRGVLAAGAPISLRVIAVTPVVFGGGSFGSGMLSEVNSAFKSGNALEFWRACRRADYEPPANDDAQQALLLEGRALDAAERFAAALSGPVKNAVRSSPTANSARKINYEAFGRALKNSPPLSENIFHHTAYKLALLKAAGYTRLHVAGGKSIAIDFASNARIGRAFASVLSAYRKQLPR